MLDGEDPSGRRKRADLKSYYGLDGSDETKDQIPKGTVSRMGGSADPCDINSSLFQPDVYLSRLIQVYDYKKFCLLEV